MKLLFLRTVFVLSLLGASFAARADDSANVLDLLPDKLEGPDGRKIPRSAIEGKTVALYFSASWCAPCRHFTPLLLDFRSRHHEDDFEVLFVSFDRSISEKRAYVRKSGMPWPSTPGRRTRINRKLADLFDVRAYPALVVIGADGEVLARDGRAGVTGDPENALANWREGRGS